MTSLLRQTAAVVSLLSFFAAPLAHAGQDRYASYKPGYGYGYGDQRHGSYHRRIVSLGFDRLEARIERDLLVVDYKIQKQSFRMLKRQGIVPVIRVERVRAGFLEAPLQGRKGRVTFAIPRHMRDGVTVSVAGGNANVVIDSLWLHGAPASSIELAVARPRPARPLPWSMQRSVLDACRSSFDSRFDRQACLEIADGFSFDPTPTILACEMAMDGDANEMACLRIAARSRMDVTRQLMACEAAFHRDANELSCFSKVVGARFDMVPAVAECGRAFESDANGMACLDTALRFDFDPVPAIRACTAQSRWGEQAELACLARY